MHIYPYKAKRFIREANDSLGRMEKTNDIDELKRSFISFLNASRFSTQQLLTDYSKLNNFSDWWLEKKQFLENNNLCKFFKKLRNDVTKGGVEVLDIFYELKGSNIIRGPMQIGPDGVLFAEPRGGIYEWVPKKVGGLTITSCKFIDQPKEFDNKSSYSLCKEYLDILNKIIDEFIEKFGSYK